MRSVCALLLWLCLGLRAANPLPEIKGVPTSSSFVEGAGPLKIAPAIVVKEASEALSPFIRTATISFVGNYQRNADQITVYDIEAETIWDAENGTLVISRKATAGEYTAFLMNATYECQGHTPQPGVRRIALWIVDDEGKTSIVQNSSITVQAVNDVPTLTGLEPYKVYTGEKSIYTGLTLINPMKNIKLVDLDHTHLKYVKLNISAAHGDKFKIDKGDRLTVTYNAMEGNFYSAGGGKIPYAIGQYWDPDQAEFILMGDAPVYVYETLLQLLDYHSETDKQIIDDNDRVITVRMSDGVVESTATTRIKIVQALNISIQPPVDTETYASGPISIKLNVTGTGPFTYEWYKYGKCTDNCTTVADKDRQPWPADIPRLSRTLHIPTTLFGFDDVYYRCKVTNAGGSIWSNPAKITVKKGMPTWYTLESDRQEIVPVVAYQNNEEIAIKWQPASGNGDVITTYVVYFKGDSGRERAQNYIVNDSQIELIKDRDVHFSTSESEWEFMVLAYNGLYSMFSGILKGIVANPVFPHFDKDVNPDNLLQGLVTTRCGVGLEESCHSSNLAVDGVFSAEPYTDATLVAAVSATPEATFQWFKDGVLIPDKIQGTLLLSSLDASSHDGSYSAIATNYLGSIESKILKVKVNQGATEVVLERLGPPLVKGNNLILKCSSDGFPTPKYQFFKNGNPVSFGNSRVTVNDEQSQITLDSFTTLDEGNYHCRAINSACETMKRYGKGTCTDSLEVPMLLDDCVKGEYRDESGRCRKCQAGLYQALVYHKLRECVVCPLGRFQQMMGQSSCQGCAAGTYADTTGSAVCTRCAPGKYAGIAATTLCDLCPSSKFSDTAGSNKCSKCDAGFAQDLAGQTACTSCAPGNYAPRASTLCLRCKPGQMSPSPGAGACVDCAVGRYQDKSGDFECKSCPKHSFNNITGQHSITACLACLTASNHSHTAEDAANSSSLCVCQRDYFNNISAINDTVQKCGLCPDGADCRNLDTQKLTMRTLNGWWRETVQSLQFYRCDVNHVDFYGRSYDCGGNIVADQCANFTEGVLCSQCIEGYWRVGPKCVECADGSFDFTGLMVLCAIVLVVGYVGFFFMRHDRLHSAIQEDFARLLRKAQAADLLADGIVVDEKEGMQEVLKKPNPALLTDVEAAARRAKQKQRKSHRKSRRSVKEPRKKLKLSELLSPKASRYGPRFHTELMGTLKILLSWTQCLSMLSLSLLRVPWPADFKTQLKDLNAIFNFDIIAILAKEECYMDTSFLASFRLQCLVLPAFVTILYASYQIITQLMLNFCESKRMFHLPPYPQDLQLRIARIRATRSFFFVLFLIYPGLCNKLFAIFKCTTIGSKSYLNADYSVECWNGEHMVYVYVTIGMLLLYAIGLPMLVFMTIKKNIAQIRENPGDPILKITYGCLYAQYGVHAAYFELYNFMRKFCLSTVVLMIDDVWLALFAAFLVCFTYFVLLLKTRPLRHNEEFVLEQITSAQLLCSIVLGFIVAGKAKIADVEFGHGEEGTFSSTVGSLEAIESVLMATFGFTMFCLSAGMLLTFSPIGISCSRIIGTIRKSLQRNRVKPAAMHSLVPTVVDPKKVAADLGGGMRKPKPVLERKETVKTLVEKTANQNEELKEQNNALTTALVHIQKQYQAAAQELTAMQQDRGAVSDACVQELHALHTKCDHILHRQDLSHQRTIRNCGVCKRPVSVRPGRPMDCCTKCGFLCCFDCATAAHEKYKAHRPNRWQTEDLES